MLGRQEESGDSSRVETLRQQLLEHPIQTADVLEGEWGVGDVVDELELSGWIHPRSAAGEQSPTALELRPCGWRVDVAATTVRTALTTSIMTAAQWLSGIDQTPAAVMTAVLPMLIVTERAHLDRRKQYLPTQLQQKVGSAQGLAVHPDALSNKLPLDVRDQPSPLDFQDLLDGYIAAGLA